MKNLDFNNILVYGLMLLFAAVYLITFPKGWLISDEYTYVNQAIAITRGQTNLTFLDHVLNEYVPYSYTRYSLGNSFWIAMWAEIFGVRYIYLGSLFALTFGSFLLFKTLRISDYIGVAIGLVFIYPSFEFFGVSVMSAVPSFLIVCIFVWYLFSKDESKWKWFGLAMLASFSFWFRETNIVLLGLICFIHFLQDRRWFIYYLMGAVIGFIPRLLSSHYFYDDPFYYLLAESFSLSNIVNNYLIYSLLILICMPFGLFFLALYKGKYRVPIIASSMVFLGLYLTYSFNASAYSGFDKGVLLMGRFLIPLLPFYILAVAWYFRNWKLSRKISIALILGVTIGMIGMKYKVYQEGSLHKSISTYVYGTYGEDHVFFDLSRKTNIVRYLNPMHGTFANQADITRLSDSQYTDSVLEKYNRVYIIQTINTANQAKQNKTKSITDIVDQASQNYQISEVEKHKIKPGLALQILKIGKREE